MKILKQLDYYKNNSKYTKHLDRGRPELFEAYTNEVLKYSKFSDRVLDVGSGTGIVVNELFEKNRDAYGVEISAPSVNLSKKTKKGKYTLYSGNKIPFKDECFSVVGSFTVLEHVDNVSGFLKENLRLVKTGGYLVICAPNFLSVTSSYHYRTQGFIRKVLNILITLYKIFNLILFKHWKFDRFSPVIRPDFQPDDDAVNLINPIDVLAWGESQNLELINYRGSILASGPPKYIGLIPLINLFTGGVFVTFRKQSNV